MPPRIPDDQREAILADIKSGLPRNEIARKHKRSGSTVSGIAKQAGLTDAFDRSEIKNATEARQADDHAKRAQLAGDALSASTEALVRLRKRVEDMSDRELITFFGVAADKHLALDRHDSETHGLPAVDAWLRDMIGE